MTEYQLREREVQLARYRLLEHEVTDPLAACLLHSIIEELEAELRICRESAGTGLFRTA
jgi:hypothetical protein